MRFIIDRIENKLAVCRTEADKPFTVDIQLLPYGVKEQDWLVKQGGEYQIDKDYTDSKKAENIALYKKLKGGEYSAK